MTENKKLPGEIPIEKEKARALTIAHATLHGLARTVGPLAASLFIERLVDDLQVYEQAHNPSKGLPAWPEEAGGYADYIQYHRKLVTDPMVRLVLSYKGMSADGKNVTTKLKMPNLIQLPPGMFWKGGRLVDDQGEHILPDNHMSVYERACAAHILWDCFGDDSRRDSGERGFVGLFDHVFHTQD